MLKITLFTNYRFDTKNKAKKFFEFLNESKSVLTPVLFGDYEATREKYNPKKLDEPIELLSGSPENISGEIFLKGEKFKSLSWIRWRVSGVSEWYIELDEKYFDKSGCVEEFIDLLSKLCEKFPVIYGGAAPEEDWDAKHFLTEEDEDGGETVSKLGLNLEKCLPGIYWLTIFGKEIAKHFGNDKLTGLDVYQTVKLGKNGIGIVIRENPYLPESSARLRQDAKIVKELGAEYFFDIKKPKKRCREISKVTDLNDETAEDQETNKEQETNDIEVFESQIVKSVDGEVFTNPDALAETLIAYLHSDVKEINGFSAAALKAIDKQFINNPPENDYNDEFLFNSFIPALGAYLGKVLVKELKGKWNLQKLLLKSTVTVGKKEISPFREAHWVIFNQGSLLNVLETYAYPSKR